MSFILSFAAFFCPLALFESSRQFMLGWYLMIMGGNSVHLVFRWHVGRACLSVCMQIYLSWSERSKSCCIFFPYCFFPWLLSEFALQLHAKYGLKGKKRKVLVMSLYVWGLQYLNYWSNTLLKKWKSGCRMFCCIFLSSICDPPFMFWFVEMLESCAMLLRSWSCIFPFSLSQVHTSPH